MLVTWIRCWREGKSKARLAPKVAVPMLNRAKIGLIQLAWLLEPKQHIGVMLVEADDDRNCDTTLSTS